MSKNWHSSYKFVSYSLSWAFRMLSVLTMSGLPEVFLIFKIMFPFFAVVTFTFVT